MRNDDLELEMHDSLEASKAADKMKTQHVADNQDLHEGIIVNDDGSWNFEDVKGDDFMDLKLFLKLGKEKYEN